MKSFLDKKLTTAVVFFFVGMAAQWSLQKIRAKSAPPVSYFSKSTTADELDQILDQDDSSNFFNPVTKLASPFASEVGQENIQIQQHEDQNFIYYKLALNGLDRNDLDIQIKNGYVAVAAKVDKDFDEGGQHMTYHSSFNRSFPAPENANAEKVEILHQQNKVILKFPKV